MVRGAAIAILRKPDGEFEGGALGGNPLSQPMRFFSHRILGYFELWVSC